MDFPVIRLEDEAGSPFVVAGWLMQVPAIRRVM
jgi:hypothetical protein